MIRDLIVNDLISLDDRLVPSISFEYVDINNIYCVDLVFLDLRLRIFKDGKSNIATLKTDKLIYNDNGCRDNKNIELLILLYNNKEKITEIVLKYL